MTGMLTSKLQDCVQNTGTLQRLAASPVGSRVLQSCVKHGSAEQRKQILQELQSQMVELSKSPYAYHVVCKLIDTAAKSDLAGDKPLLIPRCALKSSSGWLLNLSTFP